MVGLQDRAQEGASGILDKEKARLAERMMKASETIRTVGERLSEQEDSTLGRVTEHVATSLRDAGSYIESTDPREMARDVQTFARRHRELVVVGALIAGLLLGRFLRTGIEEASGPGGDFSKDDAGGPDLMDGRSAPRESDGPGMRTSSDMHAGDEQ